MRRSITGSINLSDDYSINFDKLFQEALNEIYGNPDNQRPVNARLFDITNSALQDAFTVEFSKEGEDWGEANTAFISEFRNNGAMFAGYKAHTLTKEFIELVYNEDGTQKSFKQFKKDSQALKDQDERYLPTQYNTAIKSTRAAINYRKYLENEHLYPNLEYMESRAQHQRADHLEYVGTILPIRHWWWETHLPPGDWNCQCWVKPTRKKATAVPPEEDLNPVFANNPGLSAKFINTEETPYYKNTDAELRSQIEDMARRAEKIRQRLEQLEFTRRKFKGGGYIDVPKAGQNKHEELDNIKTYSKLAKIGGKYALLDIREGNKNPDAVNLVTYQLSDAKAPVSRSIKNAVQNSIKAASAQKVEEVVIQLSQESKIHEIRKGLLAAFHDGRAQTIRRVIIIDSRDKIIEFNTDLLK